MIDRRIVPAAFAFALSHCAQSVEAGSRQDADADVSLDAQSAWDAATHRANDASVRSDTPRDNLPASGDVELLRDTRPEAAINVCLRDAGIDPVPGVACNDLVNDAPLVNVTSSGDALPVGRGGAIVRGRYHLVSIIYFGTARGRPGRQTMMLSTTDVSQSVHDSGEGTTLRTSTVQCVNGNRLFETGICPERWSHEWTFDVLPDGVVLYGPSGSSIRGTGSASVGAYQYQRVQ